MKGLALLLVALAVLAAVRGDDAEPELVEDDEPVPVIEVGNHVDDVAYCLFALCLKRARNRDATSEYACCLLS